MLNLEILVIILNMKKYVSRDENQLNKFVYNYFVNLHK
jgi:hypothetical protein